MRNPNDMPAWCRWLLRCLSPVYGLGVRLRNLAYGRQWKRSIKVDVPVVSVGNLTVGGTGKTPCVEWVARLLSVQGRSVCLISRGYGANASGMNDEAMLLEENLPDVPHLQNPNRVDAARTAIEELESDCLVLDDGFQHRQLSRDCDIVLIDATRPPHRDWLLPGGTLREPAKAGLKRADAIVLTRCDQADDVDTTKAWISKHCRPGTVIVETVHSVIDPPTWAANQPVAMVCGIGHPAAFRKTLEGLGANVVAEKIFPDHHAFQKNDLTDLTIWANSLPQECVIAVTQKDDVKLRMTELSGRLVTVIRIGLSFRSGENDLTRVILERIGSGE